MRLCILGAILIALSCISVDAQSRTNPLRFEVTCADMRREVLRLRSYRADYDFGTKERRWATRRIARLRLVISTRCGT